jgi:CDP-diacylglycerol--glycerol-3-phosphate 3-phosphatidyltransferase
LGFAIATFIQCPDFFKNNSIKLIFLFGIEGLTYLISYLKFKKEVATHSIGAKVWSLTLFATLIQIILQCQSVILFNVCFWLGMITRVEIIGIILALRQWTNDVPTLYHSIKLRQGKKIKRHKFFNG